MKMTSDADEKMLNDTLAQMREADVPPSEDLMNRIMLDADMVLANAAPVAAPRKQTFGAAVLDVLGGWPTFSGLAAATVAGLWIGVVQPNALTDLSSGIWGGTIEVPLLESDAFAGLEG